MPINMDQVKLKLSQLFKPELGFIKSANLAGAIIKYGGSNYRASNENQMVISLLLDAASILPRELLWCHQKATGKKGWLFKVGTSPADYSAAQSWYSKKAEEFAEQIGETQHFKGEFALFRHKTSSPSSF
jgi:hypothetical protein